MDINGLVILRWILEGSFSVLLLLSAAEDIRERKIRNGLSAGVLVSALLLWFVTEGDLSSLLEHIFSGLLLCLPLFISTLIRPGSFGGGDVKCCFSGGMGLMFSAGISALAILFFSAGAGAIWILGTGRKSENGMPLAPYIALSVLLGRYLLK